MFAKHSMAAVFFEVGRLRQKGGHAHVQAVPIPLNLKDAVESTFVEEGGLLGIDFEERAEEALASCSNGRGSYFRVDLPDGGMMVHVLKDHVPFSIQFGRWVVILSCHEFVGTDLVTRQVISTLLGTPKGHDWKECTLSEEEDRADAQAFKQAFAPFDPSS